MCKDNANERRISSLLEYFAECSLSSAKIKKSTPNEVDFLFKYIGFSYKSLLFYYLSNGMSTKVKFLSP